MGMFTTLFDFGCSTEPRKEPRVRDRERERENNPDGLTKLTRQRPNGLMTSPEASDTGLGVDRQPDSGQFAAKARDPVPLLRDHDTGQLESDEFAVGNFSAFDTGKKRARRRGGTK